MIHLSKLCLACLGCSLEAFVLLFCLFQVFPERKQHASLPNQCHYVDCPTNNVVTVPNTMIYSHGTLVN